MSSSTQRLAGRPSRRLRGRRKALAPASGVHLFPNSSPKETHKNPIEDSTTTLHMNEPAQTNPPIPPSPSKLRTRNPPSCSSLQDRKSRTHAPPRPTQAPEQRVEPLPETAASSLAQAAAAELGECGNGDHWQMAETLLKSQMTGFHRTAWAAARARHGPRAALAVIETALIVRLRAETEDPIRSAPAYLGGILRRKPRDCRPEITLQRLGRGQSRREAQCGRAGLMKGPGASMRPVRTGAAGYPIPFPPPRVLRAAGGPARTLPVHRRRQRQCAGLGPCAASPPCLGAAIARSMSRSAIRAVAGKRGGWGKKLNKGEEKIASNNI